MLFFKEGFSSIKEKEASGCAKTRAKKKKSRFLAASSSEEVSL